MASGLILLFGLTLAFAHPPEWVSLARETGEQPLRARLFELLNRLAFVDAAALVVVVLCIDRLRAAPAQQRALASARRLFVAAVAFHAASVAVAGSDSWGATAAAFSIVATTAQQAFQGVLLEAYCQTPRFL